MSSSTTPTPTLLHLGKFADKGSGVRYCPGGGIADSTLLSVATAFRTGVSRKYRTLPAKAMETALGEGRYFASIKYDGEGVFVYFDASRPEGENCVAFNAPSGRARTGLPCLKNAAKALKEKGIKKALLVAELYLRTKEGERSRVGDVIHITANGTPEERDRLGLAFYDAVMLDGKDLRPNQTDFSKTWEKLGELFPAGPTASEGAGPIHRVEGRLLTGKEIPAWFADITGPKGLEGIVVRQEKGELVYKIKPMLTVDTVAVGYVEGDFEGKYGVMSILCALTAPDGKTLPVFCRVGSGFDDNQRSALLEEFSKLKTDSPVVMTDSEGRPITFMRPEIVVEVEGESIVEETLNGDVIRGQIIVWDKEAQKYSFSGTAPSSQLTHPTFSRLRPDKSWAAGPADTRASQALSEERIKTLLHPPKKEEGSAKVFLREVYTKDSKGEKAVKKLVVVEKSGEEFHRFTIHWTDYSKGRKDPLKTETQGADTMERLEALLEPYREDAGKRGWEKVA
jgi:hypothetical protein